MLGEVFKHEGFKIIVQQIQTKPGQCHAGLANVIQTHCDRAAGLGIDQQLALTTKMHNMLVDRQRRLCS